MQQHRRKSAIPLLLAAFAIGFMLSFALLYLWLRLSTGGGRRQQVVMDTIQEVLPGGVDTFERIERVPGQPTPPGLRLPGRAPGERRQGAAQRGVSPREAAPRAVSPGEAAPRGVSPGEAAPRAVSPGEAAPRGVPRGEAAPRRARRRLAGEIGLAERAVMERLAISPAPVEPIETDLRLRAWNVAWTDGRRPAFARVAFVSGMIDIDAIERGDVIVNQAVLRDGEVLIEQPSPGAEWNYERVLADLLDGEPNGSDPATGRPATTFRLNDLTLDDITVRVRSPGSRFTVAGLEASLPRLTLSAPGLDAPELVASRLAGTYIDEVRDGRLAFDIRSATARFPTPFVEFAMASAAVENSRFRDIRGTWSADWPGIGVRLIGRGTDVRFADLRFLSPRIPAEGVGSFDFEVAPVSDDVFDIRLANADIVAEGSRITGAVHARLGGRQADLLTVDAGLDPLSLTLVERLTQADLPYAGLLRGSVRGSSTSLAFDVVAQLTSARVTTPFEARAVGIAAYSPAGLELRRLTAELREVPVLALRPLAPGLPLGGGNISGTISLTGPPGTAPLTLAVELGVAGGVATVNGTLDLTGAVPTYDLNGRLIGVDLRQIFQPAAPPAQLTASFVLVGAGTNPNTMDARFAVNGGFEGWQTQPQDTVAIEGRVRGGTLTLADTALVDMGPLRFTAFGDWRFVEPRSGALTYAFDLGTIEPVARFVALLPDTLSGGPVRGRGTITGTLDLAQVNGTIEGQDVALGNWTVARLYGEHQLLLGPAVPQINAELVTSGIRTPAAGTFTTAEATIRLRQPDLSIAFEALRSDGSEVSLNAAGVVPVEGQRRLVLQRFRIDTKNGRWALAAPSMITWMPGGPVNVRTLDIRNRTTAGLLRLDGTIYPIEQLNVRALAENLPVAEVQRLVGLKPRLTGLMDANAVIGGPPARPTVSLTFTIETGSIDGVSFARADGDVRYVRNALVAQATAVIDDVGSIEMNASLPAVISLEAARKFDLIENGAVSGSLTADSLNVAPFASLFPDLRDLSGYVTANARLSGTVASPDLSGEARLVNAEATVLPLNQRYTQISGAMTFENRRAVIRELRARSDGWAVATGSIVFETLDQPSFDVTVTLDNFRAMGVDEQTDAAADGTLRLTGAVDAPALTGEVTLSDGDVAVPDVGGNALDEQLAAIGDPGGIAATTPGDGGRGFINALRIDDLVLRAEDDVWFSADGARAQLSGELTVDKTGEDWILTGTLRGTRGTYILEAGPILRRFAIVNAEVRFLGTPEINPAIDITARRTIIDAAGRQVDIDVRIGGTLQNPTLALASGDAGAMGQEELLSFLLFGEQRIGLTGDVLPGGDILEETFFGGLAEIASIELERSLGMPFDIFQVRLGPGTLGGIGTSTVVAGVQLSSDVFLTVEYGVGALFGDADITGNNYAVRLEWRVDEQTSLSAGYEPVNRGRYFRGFGPALPVTQVQPRQVTVELRRRWNW